MNNLLKKRILFIAYFFPPVAGTGLPGSQRVVRIIKNLIKYDAVILTIKPDKYPFYFKINKNTQMVLNAIAYRTGVIDFFSYFLKIRKRMGKLICKKNHELTVNSASKKNNVNKNEIKNIKDIVSDILTYPDFAYAWIIPAIVNGLRVLRKEKIDILFATGMPWSSFIIGYILKVLSGKKLVVDFRDPWVGNPYIKNSKLKQVLDKCVEKTIINKADLVIANTDALCNEMTSRYDMHKEKIYVLPNGFDIDDFKDIENVKLPVGKLHITHAGFLYAQRDPVSLLKSMEILQKKYPNEAENILFHQVGEMNLAYDFEEYRLRNGLIDNISIHGAMEHKKCLGYLNASDVLFLIQPDTKTQIPSKLYEYIFLNKTIIAITEKEGALGRLIIDNNFGYVFETHQVNELANKFFELYCMKKNHCHINPNYENKDKFSSKTITSSFENLLSAICK